MRRSVKLNEHITLLLSAMRSHFCRHVTVILVLAFFAILNSSAQSALPNVSGIMRSASGQFTVIDRRGAMTSLRPDSTGVDSKLLELEPSLLVVSCERIKLALCKDLDASPDWRARVNITLRVGGDISLAKERIGRNWSYRIEVPHQVDRTRFIRTIVRVLLQEMADRGQGNLDGEIPPWLSEGLTQHLLASRDAELILPPPDHNLGALSIGATTLLVRDPDPLETARRILSAAPPPSIEQLSWPDVNTLDSDEGEVFRRSAQLFVSELSHLKDGKENLRGMIGNLNSFYNWQTAFLRAFQKQFPNQLALEKWWALQVSYFVGRDNQNFWNQAETATRLDELLRARVAVNLQPGAGASRSDVPLQTVIREWDSIRQNIVLKEKLRDLERARMRVAPQYIRLVDEYRAALAGYQKDRERVNATFLGIRTSFLSVDKVTQKTVAALDELDTRRAAISATLAKAAEESSVASGK
jgi:hypothetical protein